MLVRLRPRLGTLSPSARLRARPALSLPPASPAAQLRLLHSPPRPAGATPSRPNACTLRPQVQLSQLQRRAFSDDFRSRLAAEIRNGGLRRNALPIAAFGILLTAAIGAAAYYAYLYHKFVAGPLSAYPAPVARALKTALYYYAKSDVPAMVRSFKTAVSSAQDAGLHPLSDEVAGLKLECAQLLARVADGKYKAKAVEVLEKTLDECVAGGEYFQKVGRMRDRARVMKRAVLLGYRVGELYEELGEEKRAEEAMVWSTEVMLKEGIRRHQGNVKDEGEGPWFPDEERAECLEKMATHYERRSQHALATPLYLRALTLHASPSCHTVTLMTNLSASLSQQPLPSSSSSPTSPTSTSSSPSRKITREHLLQDAQKWALAALQQASKIAPPERTAECDEACVAATHNLGELAEMVGDRQEAVRRYGEAESLARALGMEEAVERSREGLRRAERMQERKKGWLR